MIVADIKSCKQRILDILANNNMKAEDMSRAQSFLHVLRIFETEMLCHLKDWNSLKQTITVRYYCTIAKPSQLFIHTISSGSSSVRCLSHHDF